MSTLLGLADCWCSMLWDLRVQKQSELIDKCIVNSCHVTALLILSPSDNVPPPLGPPSDIIKSLTHTLIPTSNGQTDIPLQDNAIKAQVIHNHTCVAVCTNSPQSYRYFFLVREHSGEQYQTTSLAPSLQSMTSLNFTTNLPQTPTLMLFSLV